MTGLTQEVMREPAAVGDEVESLTHGYPRGIMALCAAVEEVTTASFADAVVLECPVRETLRPNSIVMWASGTDDAAAAGRLRELAARADERELTPWVQFRRGRSPDVQAAAEALGFEHYGSAPGMVCRPEELRAEPVRDQDLVAALPEVAICNAG